VEDMNKKTKDKTKGLLRKTLYMEKDLNKALKRYLIMSEEYNHSFKYEYEVVEAALRQFIPESCFNKK